jgi:hypothetical protein
LVIVRLPYLDVTKNYPIRQKKCIFTNREVFMFKKIASSAFGGSAFIALSLAAFIVFFTACDSGRSGGDDNQSSSSVSSSSYAPPPPPSSGVMEVQELDVTLTGLQDHQLGFICNVRTATSENTLDSVVIKLGGQKTINKRVASGSKMNIAIDGNYEFEGQEFCGIGTFQVCAYIYMNASRNPSSLCEPIERKAERCNPSSSSVSSSSVAAVKTFSEVGTFTLNSANGDRGIVLASGTTMVDTYTADIYFDGTNTGSLKTEKNTVKIVTMFDILLSNGNWRYGQELFYASSPDPDNGFITIPSTTSQFILGMSSVGASEVAYSNGPYYMVRTASSSGLEWTSNDYLVLGLISPALSGNNKSIEIKVWKVN